MNMDDIRRILSTTPAARQHLKELTGRNRNRYTEENVLMYLRAGGRCEYCHEDLLVSSHAWHSSQTDHIIPTNWGGKDDPENKALTCAKCNSVKGHALPDGVTVDQLRDLDRTGQLAKIWPWLEKRRDEQRLKQEHEAFKALVELVRTHRTGSTPDA